MEEKSGGYHQISHGFFQIDDDMMCFNHVTSPILKIVYNFIPFAHGLLHPGHTSLQSLAPLEAHCFMMSSESFMSWNLWQNGWHSNSWYLVPEKVSPSWTRKILSKPTDVGFHVRFGVLPEHGSSPVQQETLIYKVRRNFSHPQHEHKNMSHRIKSISIGSRNCVRTLCAPL